MRTAMDNTQPTEDVSYISFYAKQWEECACSSPLKKSQIQTPDKWCRFYDHVSDIWDVMTGLSGRIAKESADVIESLGLVAEGGSVIDIGCGPGSLALALRKKGLEITAIDNSKGMIRVLRKAIADEDITGINAVWMDWKKYIPLEKFDLSVASFFPDAFSPEGLQQMETLSDKRCLLILGGGDVFPIRREIWKKVMEEPCPAGIHHATWVENYLRLKLRHPRIHHRSTPVHAVMDMETVMAFYLNYFSIFEIDASCVTDAVKEVTAPYMSGEIIHLDGMLNLVFIYWEPHRAERRKPGNNP